MKKKSSASMAYWVASTCMMKTSVQDGSCSTPSYFWNTMMPRSIMIVSSPARTFAFASSSRICRSSSSISASSASFSSTSVVIAARPSEASTESGKQSCRAL